MVSVGARLACGSNAGKIEVHQQFSGLSGFAETVAEANHIADAVAKGARGLGVPDVIPVTPAKYTLRLWFRQARCRGCVIGRFTSSFRVFLVSRRLFLRRTILRMRWPKVRGFLAYWTLSRHW